MSVLIVSKSLRPFVNTLTRDQKYSLDNKEMLPQPIQFQLCRKLNTFSRVFTPFLKSIFNFLRLEPKLSPIAYVFPKLQTAIIDDLLM